MLCERCQNEEARVFYGVAGFPTAKAGDLCGRRLMKMGRANQAASGNGAITPPFQIEHLRRAVPEQYR
jgi:hypothetical protein